jgi:hypothetical protein
MQPMGSSFVTYQQTIIHDYQTLSTSITEMNEECTGQNPQNYYSTLNEECRFNFV